MARAARVALEDVAQIAAAEWGRNAVVVVATIQSFRVEDAGQRNVYSFSESFEPHFRGVDGRALACLRDLPDALVAPEDVARDTTGVLAALRASRAGAWRTGWRCTGPWSSWTGAQRQDGQRASPRCNG